MIFSEWRFICWGRSTSSAHVWVESGQGQCTSILLLCLSDAQRLVGLALLRNMAALWTGLNKAKWLLPGIGPEMMVLLWSIWFSALINLYFLLPSVFTNLAAHLILHFESQLWWEETSHYIKKDLVHASCNGSQKYPCGWFVSLFHCRAFKCVMQYKLSEEHYTMCG